ncbi:hypothetical protein Nepgr_001563 [Nepenthes gracilis]|uniref:SANT domain-containing protein n=1 Tax=Nepenthes gracilis TaxID=150966 RepID=A0AAD3P8F9_NEPGR|nr:hypothetical protein Nepgr_001563 [Nepenthes gracilis]
MNGADEEVKSANKRFAAVNEFSPKKDAGVSNKSKQKKRKLTDMLGPQWGKEELERFYEAYRKYGKDWKKVSSIVGDRSMEMVEALYNINRAYLSLPDGTASVVGLIAMMTDHYNVLGGSGSDREGDNSAKIPKKHQKYLKVKVQDGFHKEGLLQSPSVPSSGRCLSLLKGHYDGLQPFFPVRKRTPRIPVPSLEKDYMLDYDPPKKKARKSENLNDDEVAHGAALVLTEARQSSQKMPGKHSGTRMDNERADGGLESSRGENGGFLWETISRTDTGKFAFVPHMKGKEKEKEEVEDAENRQFDDTQEECAGAATLCKNSSRRKSVYEAKNAKSPCFLPQAQRKRNNRLLNEDDSSAFDALQTLVDLSLTMPASTAEPVESSRESAIRRDIVADSTVHYDATIGIANSIKEYKRKRKSLSPNIWNAEVSMNSRPSKLAKREASAEETKSADGSRQDPQTSALTEQCKSTRSPDVSSSNGQQAAEADIGISSIQFHTTSQIVPPRRGKSRRKMERESVHKCPQMSLRDRPSNCSSLPHEMAHSLKDKLSFCLSWSVVRWWCVFEWFYSAIDYPWFAKREFVEYLNHVGLGHIPRLTRVEWGVIRSSLGRPRRFSEPFLHEEREKLKQYRESVRAHYSELRGGLREGLPTDLARPLQVGQQVIAIHPKTREFHDGSILTVDYDKCRVQFDDPDLGVEFVQDIDCMPLNPVENIPEALRRQKISFDFGNFKEPKIDEEFAPTELTENVDACFAISPFSQPGINQVDKRRMVLHAKVAANGRFKTPLGAQTLPCAMVHMQSRENNSQSISQLIRTADKKVSSSQLYLEQRSTAPGNSPYMPQTVTTSVGASRNLCSSGSFLVNSQEPGFNLAEIVKASRQKAHGMVDSAIKAILLVKEGEDAFAIIGEALDATDTCEPAASCRGPAMASPSSVNCSLACPIKMTSTISEQQITDDASAVEPSVDYEGKDQQLPSELITSCVATLLMIQKCTQRQYPPAEVAEILDTAVTSLHPCCPQNLSIYRDIELCMGRIKTQILALVPT